LKVFKSCLCPFLAVDACLSSITEQQVCPHRLPPRSSSAEMVVLMHLHVCTHVQNNYCIE